jgi:hypothetical protein
MRRLTAPLAALALSACAATPDLDAPKLSDRTLKLEEFLAGELVAHGQFVDVFGTVSRRFTVDIDGDWDGETLTLTEDFTYEDGSTERRVWTLTKTGPDTWQGTAPGVIGTATGRESGDTFNWRYTIDLPVAGGGTVRVAFDDWMWLLADDRLLNIAYMSRLGVRAGTVTIFFERL